MNKKSILILFDGPHLAYSPTTIQLYDALSQKFFVEIFAQDPNNYNGQTLQDRNVIYHPYFGVKQRMLYNVLFSILRYFSINAKAIYKNKLSYRDYFFKFRRIKNLIKSKKYQHIICNDAANAFYCSLLNIPFEFLSLELCKDENLWNNINKKLIKSVIIQSIERYEYLFKQEKFRMFIIQNAPTFIPLDNIEKKDEIIYSGSTINSLGFYQCLDYLRKYPNEKMTILGAFYESDKKRVIQYYNNLLTENRLYIEEKYLENDEVVHYLKNFKIGFCFYNFDDPHLQKNYFNYYSAPSGKMFKYLAAGVPVVCSDILGFNFVNKMQCGIAIKNLDPDSIYKAIATIRSNYKFYENNAIEAAKLFSFDKAASPFINYLESQN